MKEFVDVFPNIVVVRAHWSNIHRIKDWCAENHIKYNFKNHWMDDKGTFISMEIPDEKDRVLFMLRWS